MPRPKTINTNSIRLEKVNAAVIEVKDCLGIEFIFNTLFTPEQIKVLKDFYGFQVSSDGRILNREVGNSWKGLVSLLVSLAYCRYQNQVVARIWDCVNDKKIREKCRLRVDFNYTAFLSDDDISKLQRQSIVTVPNENIIEYFQDREAYKAKSKEEQKQRFKDLLRKRPPDFNFENVAAPKTWKPCYMSGKYTPKDIETYLKLFANLLDIDRKKSTIITEFANQLPHNYKTYPARYLG